jgi:hypothetical protein
MSNFLALLYTLKLQCTYICKLKFRSCQHTLFNEYNSHSYYYLYVTVVMIEVQRKEGEEPVTLSLYLLAPSSLLTHTALIILSSFVYNVTCTTKINYIKHINIQINVVVSRSHRIHRLKFQSLKTMLNLQTLWEGAIKFNRIASYSYNFYISKLFLIQHT